MDQVKQRTMLELVKVAKEKGLSASCVFLPIQPFEKVVMYEKAMDVLSIPYLQLLFVYRQQN